MRRFYIDKIEDNVTISGDDHSHLAYVLRHKIGDCVTLCPQDGYDYTAEITSITKSQTCLKVIEKKLNLCEPTMQVTLFSSLTKGDKMELIAQKATELGVSSIVPITTKFIQVKPESVKRDRLKRIIDEAAKQCGRGKLPELASVTSFSEMLPKLKDYEIVIFPYEKAEDNDLKSYLSRFGDDIKSIAIIIGSEGGFSYEEAESLAAICKPVSLGNRILRAETANIAVLSIVMYHFGQLAK